MQSLNRTESETFLREVGTGTLALTNDGDTYAFPASFGYGDGTVYFQFAARGESKKHDYLETTERACLTVWRVDDADEWTSVNVYGDIGPVPDSDESRAYEAFGDNADIPGFDMFGAELGSVDLSLFRLAAEEVTGRAGALSPE